MKAPASRAAAFCGLLILSTSIHSQSLRNPSEVIIENMLTKLQHINKVPALSVAIARRGRLEAVVTVGEKDIVNHIAATPATAFRLASVSKVVGATMLANLVQGGYLDPHEPIKLYLPGLPEHYGEITTIQLLAHTSGLPHYQSRDSAISAHHYLTARETLPTVGNRSLLSIPGEQYTYSSHGYTILGALFEAVTQKQLRLSTRDFISEFTGLETPMLEDVTRRNPSQSNVFELDAHGPYTVKHRDQSYSPFGTGFIATASDLAMFGNAVLNSTMLSKQTREMMFTPVNLPRSASTGTYLYKVAFGWRVGTDHAGRRVAHHAGITQGARSVLILFPDDELSVAILSNASWTAQIERTGFYIADVLLEAQTIAQVSGEYSFTGTFNDEPVEGYLQCEQIGSECSFSDNAGALSSWLASFNHTNKHSGDWPALVVLTPSGLVIKLITTVGISDLRFAPDDCPGRCYQTEFGHARELKLQFTHGFRSDDGSTMRPTFLPAPFR